MAALGRLSRVLLRSALTQSRRQLSAAVAGHGEQAGNSSALCFNPPGWRSFCSVCLDSNVFLLWQWPCCTSASRLALAANSSLSGQDVRAASQNTDFPRSVRQFDAVLSPHKTHYGYLVYAAWRVANRRCSQDGSNSQAVGTLLTDPF